MLGETFVLLLVRYYIRLDKGESSCVATKNSSLDENFHMNRKTLKNDKDVFQIKVVAKNKYESNCVIVYGPLMKKLFQ